LFCSEENCGGTSQKKKESGLRNPAQLLGTTERRKTLKVEEIESDTGNPKIIISRGRKGSRPEARSLISQSTSRGGES